MILNLTLNLYNIFGSNDTIITKDQSLKLASFYNNATIFNHDGFHIVPSNSNAKKLLMILYIIQLKIEIIIINMFIF